MVTTWTSLAKRRARRGGMYVAVLAVATVVTVLALSAMLSVRVQAASGQLVVDAVEARLDAEAGADLFAQYTSANSNWRTRAQGTWWSSVSVGKGTCSVSVTDPLDGDLSNREYDPVLVRATGSKGGAKHLYEVTLQPSGTPISALGVAIQASGQVRVLNTGVLTVNVGALSTNTTLKVDGRVTGRAECLLSVGSGVVSGGITVAAPLKTMPASTILSMYKALSTPIVVGSAISGQVLGPGVNTIGGTVNADGVYFIDSSQDITIKNFRLCGTLVINCPGKTVTISGPVLMQPARADYPVLIINGQADFNTDATVLLSEATVGVNFNPAGAPYAGATDKDLADSYPTEIQGLIHTMDRTILEGKTHITGVLICDSTDVTQAVSVDGSPTIDYDMTLYSSPPMLYTSSVQLKVKQGSWKQLVLP